MAQNRGRAQRDRGRRAEYKVRDRIREAGYQADRVPISGAGSIKGDVMAEIEGEHYVFEVKHKAEMPVLLTRYMPDWQVMPYILQVGGKKWQLAPMTLWLVDHNTRELTHARAHPPSWKTVKLEKLPRWLEKMLQQAEREQAVLVIVFSRQQEMVVVQPVV